MSKEIVIINKGEKDPEQIKKFLMNYTCIAYLQNKITGYQLDMLFDAIVNIPQIRVAE